MDKISILNTFFNKLGLNVVEFLEHYQNQFFPKTKIEKSSVFKNLINNCLTEEQQNYIDQMCNLPNRDSRTPTEYARDLVISWLVEDIIQVYLGLSKNGADAQRDFLRKGQIKYDSDFIHNNRHLELYVNFTNYWTKTKKIDLRMDKYQHLVDNKALLLGIAFESCQFFLIDFEKENLLFYENYNYFWKKKCYTCQKYDNFHDISEIRNFLSKI